MAAGGRGEVSLVFCGSLQDALEFEDYLREHVDEWILTKGQSLSIQVSALPTPQQLRALAERQRPEGG